MSNNKESVVNILIASIEYQYQKMLGYNWQFPNKEYYLQMEQTNIDNKVIHFAEWLTKKHTTELMTLYSQFQEQNYKKSTDSE